jgi:hypothetical protein
MMWAETCETIDTQEVSLIGLVNLHRAGRVRKSKTALTVEGIDGSMPFFRTLFQLFHTTAVE